MSNNRDSRVDHDSLPFGDSVFNDLHMMPADYALATRRDVQEVRDRLDKLTEVISQKHTASIYEESISGEKTFFAEGKSQALLLKTESTRKARFLKMALQWKEQTAYLSSAAQAAMHPAYQQIIGMGPPVIGLILFELKKKPDHWFWALRAITGEDPVQEDHKGNVEAMANDWLDWARTRGYVSD